MEVFDKTGKSKGVINATDGSKISNKTDVATGRVTPLLDEFDHDEKIMMNLEAITNNPFRGVGVFAGLSEQELSEQKNKVLTSVRASNIPTSDVDFYFLDPIKRTPETLKRFFSQLERPIDRFRYALFWFVVGDEVEEVILSCLQDEEGYKKAIDISKKMVMDKEITQRTIFVVNNLSTLLLLSQKQEDVAMGVHLKVKMLLSPCIDFFIEKVSGVRLALPKEDMLDLFIKEFIDSGKQSLSDAEILNLFVDGSKEAMEPLMHHASYIQDKNILPSSVQLAKLLVEASSDTSAKAWLTKEGDLSESLNQQAMSNEDLSYELERSAPQEVHLFDVMAVGYKVIKYVLYIAIIVFAFRYFFGH